METLCKPKYSGGRARAAGSNLRAGHLTSPGTLSLSVRPHRADAKVKYSLEQWQAALKMSVIFVFIINVCEDNLTPVNF